MGAGGGSKFDEKSESVPRVTKALLIDTRSEVSRFWA